MKKLNTVIIFIISIKNIIFINFKIFFLKKKNKKKIIVYYHPKPALTKIHDFYVKDLFYKINPNFEILHLYNLDLLNKNFLNSLLIVKQILLRWIFGVDIFISSNVCDVFTKNSTRVYMHHTIYDTPLISENKEKEFLNRVLKFDYFFLSSNATEKFFNYLFRNISKSLKPKTYHIGYPKIDYFLKKKKNYKKKKAIIVAPTLFDSFPNLSLKNSLEQIIKKLLQNKKYHIVFRPHPSDVKSEKVNSVFQKFNKIKNFSINTSDDYFKLYKESECLITDISDTAYTYAILTGNPVMFVSIDEKYVKRYNKKKGLKYFKKRRLIGNVLTDVEKININLNLLKKRRKFHNV